MTDDVRSWGCKWLVMVEHITSCTTRSGGHCPAAVHPLNHLPLPGLTICGNDVGGCQPARFSGRTRVPIGTSNRLSVSTSARKSRSLKPGNICRERETWESGRNKKRGSMLAALEWCCCSEPWKSCWLTRGSEGSRRPPSSIADCKAACTRAAVQRPACSASISWWRLTATTSTATFH